MAAAPGGLGRLSGFGDFYATLGQDNLNGDSGIASSSDSEEEHPKEDHSQKIILEVAPVEPEAPPANPVPKPLTMATYAICALSLGVTYAINSFIAAQATDGLFIAILASSCSSTVNIILTAEDTKKDLWKLWKNTLELAQYIYHGQTTWADLKRWVANLTLLWLILQLSIPAATTLSNALQASSQEIGAAWLGNLLLYPTKWIQTVFITKDAFFLSRERLIRCFPSLAVPNAEPQELGRNLTPYLNKTKVWEAIRWGIAGLVVAGDTFATATAINDLYKNNAKDWVDQLMVLTHIAGGKYLENFWFALFSNAIQVFLFTRLAKQFLDFLSEMLKHAVLNPKDLGWKPRTLNIFKDLLLLGYFFMTSFNVVEIARSGVAGKFHFAFLNTLMLVSTNLLPASALSINGATYPTLRTFLDSFSFNVSPDAFKRVVSWALCAVTLGVAYAVNSFLGAAPGFGLLVASLAAACSSSVNIVLTGEEIKEELSNLWNGGCDLIQRMIHCDVALAEFKNWFKNLALLYVILQLSIPAAAVLANGFQASCRSIGTSAALDLDRALTYPIKWIMAVFLTKDLFKKLRIWFGLAPAPEASALPIRLSIEIDRCSEAIRWILAGTLTLSLILGSAPSINMLYKNNSLDWMDKLMILPYFINDILLKPGMALAISAVQGPLYARLMKNSLVYFGDMAKKTFLNPWGLACPQRSINLIKDVTLLGYFFMTMFNIMQIAKTSHATESFGIIPKQVMSLAILLLPAFAFICNAATYPVLRSGLDLVFQACARKFGCQKLLSDLEQGEAGAGSSTPLLAEQRAKARASSVVSTGSLPGVPKLQLHPQLHPQ